MSFLKKQTESKKDFDPDIISLNQISKYGIEQPKYKQDLSKQRTIEFVFLPEEKVMLIGSMSSSRYPYWISITDVNDIQTNTSISNYILFGDFSKFTSKINFFELIKDRYSRCIYLENDTIKTPFKYTTYSSEPDQIQYWGNWTAIGILEFYQSQKELCRLRECEGRYIDILQEYLKILENQTSDDILNYKNNENLIKLIESEDYLLLSSDKTIRETYIKASNIISDLYNKYMTIVK